MIPFELNIEVQEMPADGSKCTSCENIIEGTMFQYFLFESNDLDPTPTKYKLCEPCYKETIKN